MKVLPLTVLVNPTLLVVPLQIVDEDGVAVATGLGFTVTSTVKDVPAHPLAVGTTVYRTTPLVEPVFVKVCAIVEPQDELQLLNPVIVEPENCAAVQVNVVPPNPAVKATLLLVPEQIV